MKTNYLTKKRCLLAATVLLCGVTLLTSCKKESSSPEELTNHINYHFATKSEGQQLLLAHTDYYNSLNQNDIEWRMKKTGATLDELISFSQSSVMDFTDEDKEVIGRVLSFIERRLDTLDIKLPFPKDDIVFIKTTMEEESNAGAYTHKTEIFLGDWIHNKINSDDSILVYEMIAHELFHCLTRNSPEFRSQIYGLIGFTTTGHDFTFSQEINNLILTNPDVEHMDNYAEFTINGEKRDCELLVLYTKTWAEASALVGDNASFFNFNQCVLVPIDALDTYYSVDDVPDFWDKVGRNTYYVFAPEECLADNFGFAIVDGPDGRTYESPELITSMISFLNKYKNNN